MSRRSNGEGCIRKRNGKWYCEVMQGYYPDGRRNMTYLQGKTKKEVLAQYQKLRRDLDDGLDTSANYTFAQWADIWFDSHKDNISPTTRQSYTYTLRKLKDAFGHRKLESIKPFDIERYLRSLREEGLSDSYLAKTRAMLYQIYHKAEANDLVRKNPARFAEKMRSTGLRERKDAFTAEEIELLMEHLPEDRVGHGIRLLLGTGMRTQELLGLEKRHISEDGSSIHIEQAVQQVKGTVVVGPPKSRDSYRLIPVPQALWVSAKYLRDHAPGKYIWEVGKPGQPCNPSYFRDKFKVTLTAIEGVRVLTPHSCRHTYVSQLQALGVDLSTIQSLVGHVDTDMTQHYLHVQTPVRLDAAERFSEAFCRPK